MPGPAFRSMRDQLPHAIALVAFRMHMEIALARLAPRARTRKRSCNAADRVFVMETCHQHYPWVLSVPFRTNCAYNGVILPVCANNSDCPGVCVVPKAGSTLFKTSMEAELSRLGTPMVYEPGCAAVHCAQFPWPAWPTPQLVVRIVRHPITRMLSAYLNGKHLNHHYGNTPFSPNASFAEVVRRITSLPDLSVNAHMRRQTAMCAVAPPVQQRILKLEDYSAWRSWLLKELRWSPNALPADTPEQAVSAERVAAYYTPELRQRVLLWAADDLKQFGYHP